MEKDLKNIKKWFEDLGFNDELDEGVLKKLMPPQRRDMWRNIMKHVRPKEEVNLVKKTILLHKLQKRQKPLIAKVESDEDLANALKYEELITKYNKIQKEIIDVKMKNNQLKSDLNEKIEYKKTVLKNIELKQNRHYLDQHKIEYHDKFIKDLNEISNICDYFSPEANENLTQTDYEDSLIKCFIEVDDAKESGIMNESVNIGKKLCNVLFTIVRDKSPKLLVETIERNLMKHINESNMIILETKETAEIHNDDENVFNEFIKKLTKKQLEFKSKLSVSLTEKECVTKHLIETTHLVKNEIISQYKLIHLLCTDDELQIFKNNLEEALQIVIKKSIDCAKIGFHETMNHEGEKFKMVDDIFEQTIILKEEIEKKRISVCEMLKELNNKKSDFGLTELKCVVEKLAEDYSKNVGDICAINKTINSIKDSSSCDADNIIKISNRSITKSNFINFQTLEDIKQNSEIIDVVSEAKTKVEQFNDILKPDNNFNEITRKENMLKSEFSGIVSRVETKISSLDSIIEDSQLIADTLAAEWWQNLTSRI